MCAFEEDQGPASKKRASLSTSEPRVSGQIGMPRFEMFIETARVWETSGKPPASSLPRGISALPLLVPAKAGSAEACSEQNTGKKKMPPEDSAASSRKTLATGEFQARSCSISGSFMHPQGKRDKFLLLQKPQQEKGDVQLPGKGGIEQNRWL